MCILTINSNKNANKSDLDLLMENYKNGVSDCEIMITNYEIVELSEWKNLKMLTIHTSLKYINMLILWGLSRSADKR